MDRTVTDVPWATWPWTNCPASTGGTGLAVAHCDLKKGHDGPHIAERGLGADICWTEHYRPSPLDEAGRLRSMSLADQADAVPEQLLRERKQL